MSDPRPLALVTGASSGIGLELARQFAGAGLDLVVTAEDAEIGAGPKDDPAQVAEQGFQALMAGEDKVVAGSLKTKVQGVADSVLPDRLKAQAHAKMAEPGSGE